MTSCSVGLSFGSESVVVAVTNTSGNPQVYANADGNRVTPTYVSFIDGEVLHGTAARAAFVRQPVQSVPYLLPLLSAEVVNEGAFSPKCDVEVVADAASGMDRVVIPSADSEGVLATTLPKAADADADDKTNAHLTSEIIASFLNDVKVKTIDGPCSGRSIGCLCVSVPRYMDQAVVRAAVESANIAKEVRIIYDDVATSMAHQIGVTGGPLAMGESAGSLGQHMPTGRNDILVIDWGANVLAASALRLEGGAYRVLGHKHRFNSGAAFLDKSLAKVCCANFYKKTRIEAHENARAMRKLLLALEGVRKTLTMSTMAPVDVEAFIDGMDLKDNLSRVKLDMTIRECGLLDKLSGVISDLLEVVDPAEKMDISHVILAGGLCRTQYIASSVKATVKHLIPETEDAEFYDSIPTDEVAALGACAEAFLSTASHDSLTKPQADVHNTAKYRPVDAFMKDIDVVDVEGIDAGIALYIGSAPFAKTATAVSGDKVAEFVTAAPTLASPTSKANFVDFTKAATEKGAYQIANDQLYDVVVRGAPMPISTPLVEASIGAAVLPLAVIATTETHSYVVPLFKQPYKLTTANFKVLLNTENHGAATAVSVVEVDAQNTSKKAHSIVW